MKRYELTIERVYIGTDTVSEIPYLTAAARDDGSWCLASDVAELESELAEAMKLLRSMVDTIDAHDIDSLSCDRDGKEYCECLSQTLGNAQAFLARQEAKHE